MVGSGTYHCVSLLQKLCKHHLIVIIHLTVRIVALVLVHYALSVVPVNVSQTDNLYIVVKLLIVLLTASVEDGMTTPTDAYTEDL